VLALACAGCGPGGTPEEEIRALVDAGERAAEARDASGLKALVADDYDDPQGRDAGDLRTLLHGYLIAHPSLRLVTKIDSIELEGSELAQLRVTVGVLSRGAESESDWDLAADVHRLDVRLARGDDGEWRAIRAGLRENR
jgi:hypothetical protein